MVVDSPGATLRPAPEMQQTGVLLGCHFSPAFWIPREVSCRCCQAMAMMESTELVREDEMIVRYDCPDCGWRQARHFIEQEMDNALEV